MMKTLLTLLVLTQLISCSFNRKKQREYPSISIIKESNTEITSHLEQVLKNYLKANRKKVVKISGKANKYLNRITSIIFENNETLLGQKQRANFYVIRDKRSFYFSMPNNNYIFSTRLIRDFIKNESVLISLLAREMIRSNRSIYKRSRHIPFEKYSLEQVIKLAEIELDTKVKLNNLTIEVVKRAGYDPEALLLWTQMQNRNSIDFKLVYENINQISKEEFYLKDYIVSNSIKSDAIFEKNSSRGFYNFRKEINAK